MSRKKPTVFLAAWNAFSKSFETCWKRYTGWELGLLLLGWAGLISLIVILFLPIAKGPILTADAEQMPPVTSPAFLQTLSRHMAIPVDAGSVPQTLTDGNTFVRSLIGDISRARRSINFMVYIWDDGKFSDMVLSHLERKQRQGVEVRIILDAYGAKGISSSKFRRLEEAGGRVAVFRSLVPVPWNVLRNTKRNHRRSIVIDGETGYTGGIAVADSWLGEARNPDEWHDFMFRMTGTMAARLQGSFAETWARITGEVLLGDKIYPPYKAPAAVPYVTVSTSPSPDLFEGETFAYLSLLAARMSIYIENPYFLPDATIRNILKQKAKSGVRVVLVLPNHLTDQKSVRWAGQRIFTELMEAGVKIYEYQPTFTHAKLFIVDSHWSVVGTANWDHRSRKINDEIIFGVSNEAFARELEDKFFTDLGRSKEITLDQWRKRGPLQRSLELLSQTFVQQY